MAIAIFVIVAFAGSFLAGRYLDGINKLTRDYPGPEAFGGPLYEACVYGITIGDVSSVLCLVGASEIGVYLTNPPGLKKGRFFTTWKNNHAVLLDAPILVPWSALLYRRKSFLWNDCVRFDVPSSKSCFYIPVSIAERLLGDARRQMPSGG